MAVRLILGPPNSGRAEAVQARLVAAAPDEPVLVVPTGDDASWFERELCASGAPALGISIRTFGWLFEDVADSLSVDSGPPLTGPQRLALIRAAIASTPLDRLDRSSHRPGFAPALDTLIEELQAALVGPGRLAEAAAALDDGAHEQELAELYAAYCRLRDASGRTDRGALAEAALAALRSHPDAWGSRPVFLYGFDDLTPVQLELVAALGQAADVTVAVNYADRRSLASRATLLTDLRESLGATVAEELEARSDHTDRATLRHLDRALFEPDPGTVEPDDGLVLMNCAGERGEAEAIGLEIASLLAAGADPGEIAVVVRHPSAAGQLISSVLSRYGIPAALEARAPVDRTAVGRGLITLCRAVQPDARAEELLAHMRSDPALPARFADGLERRIRRGEARSVEELIAGWTTPPRHLSRLRAAGTGSAGLEALAAIARELAEAAHREQAPLASTGAAGAATLHPLELRAAIAAAELLEEMATFGDLPGCPEPTLADAVEALEGAEVTTWRGPTDGRVRILSPYRLRAGRARYLFVASLQDGGFPAPAPPDPLLGDDRRGRLELPELRRHEQADEERYLFHACVSRPTDRLYLSWRSCDDEGAALARSPFVDEVLDLVSPDPEQAERALTRSRGLEEVVAEPTAAPSERELARSLALVAPGRPEAALASLGVEEPVAGRVLATLASVPDADDAPGPLRVPAVLEALRERRVLSAGQLEGWLTCPYKWFAEHELAPQRLDPEADPLWLGGVVHSALDRLYREAPGHDSIPRPEDVGGWQERFAELLAEEAAEGELGPERVAALARARNQVDAFLSDESRSETNLRPAPDLLERGFGMGDDDDPGGLELGEFTLRGRIDRIDVALDGSGAVVRDYKTGSRVPGAGQFADKGDLQIRLYMLVARDILGLDAIGGLYQPLGATKKTARRPRGLVLKEDERLDGLELVRTDYLEPDEVTAMLDEARASAVALGAELRSGAIDRDPLNGRCPEYCTFQPICRIERAIGLPADGENGDDE